MPVGTDRANGLDAHNQQRSVTSPVPTPTDREAHRVVAPAVDRPVLLSATPGPKSCGIGGVDWGNEGGSWSSAGRLCG